MWHSPVNPHLTSPFLGERRVRDPAVPAPIHILVDADACPVKDEIYRVALRTGTAVVVVANTYMRLPEHPLISRIVVNDQPDAADDYIVEQATPASIVITADILLAQRCLDKSATVIAPNGKPFTDAGIGMAVATRAIMVDVRAGGEQTGGPPPFTKADRSRFLNALDAALVRMHKAGA